VSATDRVLARVFLLVAVLLAFDAVSLLLAYLGWWMIMRGLPLQAMPAVMMADPWNPIKETNRMGAQQTLSAVFACLSAAASAASAYSSLAPDNSPSSTVFWCAKQSMGSDNRTERIL